MVLSKSLIVRGILGLGGAAVLASLSGCAAFGYAAAVMPKPDVRAAYKGLAGQSVGVMVWVDRGIRMDYPTIHLDIANAIQMKLLATEKDKNEDLKDATFPIQPRSIARYQAEHPETDATPVVEIAPNLNVSRLIYIEIDDFETRPNASLELYRGVVQGTLKVIEIDAAGRAKVAYTEANIRVNFPKKGPPEGMPGSSDSRIYQGTLEEFTTQVVQRFFKHSGEDDE